MRIGFKRVSAPSDVDLTLPLAKISANPSITAKIARINRIRRTIEKCQNLLSDVDFMNKNIEFKIEKFDSHEKILELILKNDELKENFENIQKKNDELEKQLSSIINRTNTAEDEEKALNKDYVEAESQKKNFTDLIKTKKAKALQTVFEIELNNKQKHNLTPKLKELEETEKEYDLQYSKRQRKNHQIDDILNENFKLNTNLLYVLSAKRAVLYHIEQNNSDNSIQTEQNQKEIEKMTEDIQKYEQQTEIQENIIDEQIQYLKNMRDERSSTETSIFTIQQDIKEVKKEISEKIEAQRNLENSIKDLEFKIQKITDENEKTNIAEIHQQIEEMCNDQTLTEKNKEIIQQHQNEIDKLNNEINELTENVQNIKIQTEKQGKEIKQLITQLNEKLKEDDTQQIATTNMKKINKRTFMKMNW